MDFVMLFKSSILAELLLPFGRISSVFISGMRYHIPRYGHLKDISHSI